ncbi:LRIG2 protein, partial [Polyodon spathula]|nr:LRIG2 protein [Polyodon spathula]
METHVACRRKEDDTARPENTAGYGVQVICSDCLNNTNTYSKNQECYSQNFRAEDHSHQQALSSTGSCRADLEDSGPENHQHYNGTVSSLEREGPMYPSNHDRMTPQTQKGPSLKHFDINGSHSQPMEISGPLGTFCPPSLEGSFHEPIKLTGLPQMSLDNKCEAKARQALPHNGHLPVLCDSIISESTPLRRASD